MPERSKTMLTLIEDLGHIMLKVTGYVMLFAPLAVWAAIRPRLSPRTASWCCGSWSSFMGGFYLSLMILWGILVDRRLHRHRAALQASAAADPRAADDRLLDRELGGGLPEDAGGAQQVRRLPRISSFVLPLGYSFNLDGTMMYCTFASIFIAQTYHIEMSLGTQLAMLATLMITSKGVAGVPRASLVVIAATLSQFNIPEAGLLMIMGIDTFLDMGRSATNVIGNSLATAVVAKWEGELAPEHEMQAGDAVPPDTVPAIRCAPDAPALHDGRASGCWRAGCGGAAAAASHAQDERRSARPSPRSSSAVGARWASARARRLSPSSTRPTGRSATASSCARRSSRRSASRSIEPSSGSST